MKDICQLFFSNNVQIQLQHNIFANLLGTNWKSKENRKSWERYWNQISWFEIKALLLTVDLAKVTVEDRQVTHFWEKCHAPVQLLGQQELLNSKSWDLAAISFFLMKLTLSGLCTVNCMVTANSGTAGHQASSPFGIWSVSVV